MVIMDFWAEWCGPCKVFAKTYEAVAKEYPDIIFGKIDTEAQPELAADFNIRSIPTIMIMCQQIVIFSQSGILPGAAFRTLINQAKTIDMQEVISKVNKSTNKM